MDCVFCRIIEGDAPSREVYRDDGVVAFLDAHPLTAGHTLVVPTTHHERLEDLSRVGAGALFEAVHELLEPVQAAAGADGATVAVNDGPAAGQEVPHVHAHIVPRTAGDGGGPIHEAIGGRPELGDEQLDAIAAAIRDRR
ncbi:MAG: HIT family protein [Halobacteriales archaeon]|nr:HIT family protein [Halobacteriales archaeon]